MASRKALWANLKNHQLGWWIFITLTTNIGKKVRNSLKVLKKGGFCDMISTVKREIAIEKELRSKIEWENALVKYTKIILPIK